jgi:hypothetical protein
MTIATAKPEMSCATCAHWVRIDSTETGKCSDFMGPKVTFVSESGVIKIETDADFFCAEFAERKP